jgi:hypothetical protein
MGKFACYMNIHNLEEWQLVDEGTLTKTGTDAVVGFWVRQQTRCRDCGKIMVSMDKTWL